MEDNYSSFSIPSAPPAYKDSVLNPSQIVFHEEQKEGKRSTTNIDSFQKFIRRHEISDYFAAKLRMLEGYDIKFILDD